MRSRGTSGRAVRRFRVFAPLPSPSITWLSKIGEFGGKEREGERDPVCGFQRVSTAPARRLPKPPHRSFETASMVQTVDGRVSVVLMSLCLALMSAPGMGSCVGAAFAPAPPCFAQTSCRPVSRQNALVVPSSSNLPRSGCGDSCRFNSRCNAGLLALRATAQKDAADAEADMQSYQQSSGLVSFALRASFESADPGADSERDLNVL
eukprot:1527792-Rhodomonas_salina.1